VAATASRRSTQPPRPGDCELFLEPSEVEKKMAAPGRDGPQHAPSPARGSFRVRMEAWRMGAFLEHGGRHVGLDRGGLLMEGSRAPLERFPGGHGGNGPPCRGSRAERSPGGAPAQGRLPPAPPNPTPNLSDEYQRFCTIPDGPNMGSRSYQERTLQAEESALLHSPFEKL